MPSLHRTPQDVYAMVIPASPLDSEFEPGETIEIRHEERVERLIDHGWIGEDYEETDAGNYTVRLTHTGAAIMNFWRNRQAAGDVLEALEQGVGEFVEQALAAASAEQSVQSWEISDITDGELTLRGETEEGVVVTRRYELTQQDEEHPNMAAA